MVTLVLSGGKYFATLSNDIIHGQSDAGHSVNKDTMMDTIKKNTLHKLPQSAQDLLSTTLSGVGKVLSFADNATTLVNVGSEGNASRVETQIAAATEKIDKLKTSDELKADPTFGDATKMMMRVMPEATTEQIKIALLANAIDGAFV